MYLATPDVLLFRFCDDCYRTSNVISLGGFPNQKAQTFDGAPDHLHKRKTLVCDRNQFARVCIKHRCLSVEVFKEGNSCAAQAFKYDHKRDDFSIVARFLVLIPATMST